MVSGFKTASKLVHCSSHQQKLVDNKEGGEPRKRSRLSKFASSPAHTMNKETQRLVKKYAKASIGGAISINDLSDKEYSGKALTTNEKIALANFEKYRLARLNAVTDDMAFHELYRQLQVMANLADYTEFLKDEYNPS
jgi:hypothetical protein